MRTLHEFFPNDQWRAPYTPLLNEFFKSWGMKIAKYACLLGDESKPTAERPVPALPPARIAHILRQTEGQREKLTKLEAVRRALAHGVDSPPDGIRFIQREYGIAISPTVFSTYKCRLRDESLPTLERKKEAIAERVEVEKPRAVEVLDLAKTIKSLVDQHGVDTVRSVVDLFTSNA